MEKAKFIFDIRGISLRYTNSLRRVLYDPILSKTDGNNDELQEQILKRESRVIKLA